MARRKVYPRLVFGRFKRFRSVLSAILQAVLFFGPWLQYDGQQAIRIDLAAHRLHFFWFTFWPQDTYFLLIILVFLALLMFASTAVAGRMWCGYACPQTLLTESFVYVETFFEGDRARRMKRDSGPWTADKAARKAAKWSVWTIMSLWLGITFAAYFQDANALLLEIARGDVSSGTATLIVTVAGAAWFDFGWFREQMCQYACPYARFQGAMFDADSLIVSYDRKRGEPRGKASSAEAGACVDCRMCTQVCPMGIDIRNGLQLECIACTACVDACDTVMDKLDRPRGLIGYTSLNEIEGRPTRLLRPRVIVYGLILAGLAGLFLFLLARRPLLVVDVVRRSETNAVYSVTADGHVGNRFHLQIINKDRTPRTLRITLDGIADAAVVAPQNPLVMDRESATDFDVFVMRPPGRIPAVTHFAFVVQDVDDPSFHMTAKSTFLGPAR